MSRIKGLLQNALLLVLSVLLGIVLVESAWRFVPKRSDVYQWSNRYMLFSDDAGDTVFRNIGAFFVYQPHRLVHSTAYYYAGSRWVKEYDYSFHTNNFGLVQLADVDPSRDALLVLGDSFTEGQGAAPWFEDIRAGSEYQLVNGGLFGTGFAQWALLHDYLVKHNTRIKKLLVIFISDDFDRFVSNVPADVLSCIANWKTCDGSEGLYGEPPRAEERPAFLDKLKSLREQRLRANDDLSKRMLPATSLAIEYLLAVIKERGPANRGYTPSNLENYKVIGRFLTSYGRDVVFVHLPQKDELKFGISASGAAARQAISAQGGLVFDGFERCGLTQADYHPHDGHPNRAGYAKIAQCVSDALRPGPS
jgi:hypothetical protein